MSSSSGVSTGKSHSRSTKRANDEAQVDNVRLIKKVCSIPSPGGSVLQFGEKSSNLSSKATVDLDAGESQVFPFQTIGENCENVENEIKIIDQGVAFNDADSDKVAQSHQNEGETKKDTACQQMMILMANLSEEQLERYETYRRSKFSKAIIRKVVRDFTKQTVNEQVAFAIAGIAKVFVGEIVEEGLDFMVQLKETGPLKPKHIREAARRLKLASNPKPSKTASGFL